MELRRAFADLRAYYNEILCLTILKCEAAAAAFCALYSTHSTSGPAVRARAMTRAASPA
jgi:hypothetical protein